MIRPHEQKIIETQPTKSIDLSKVITGLQYDGNTVKVTYLTDSYPELKAVNEIIRDGKSLIVSDGSKKWELRYVNGTITADSLINPQPKVEEKNKKVIVKPNAIIKDIERLLDNYKDNEDYSEAAQALAREIKEGYLKKWAINNNKVSLVIGTESFDKALNNLVKNYPDTDEDAKDLLSRIIEAYKTSCTLKS